MLTYRTYLPVRFTFIDKYLKPNDLILCVDGAHQQVRHLSLLFPPAVRVAFALQSQSDGFQDLMRGTEGTKRAMRRYLIARFHFRVFLTSTSSTSHAAISPKSLRQLIESRARWWGVYSRSAGLSYA
jgi:hypothetical protein